MPKKTTKGHKQGTGPIKTAPTGKGAETKPKGRSVAKKTIRKATKSTKKSVKKTVKKRAYPKTIARQKASKAKFLALHPANLCRVTATCKQVGIDRKTYYKWLEADQEFKQAVGECRMLSCEMVEGYLQGLIKKGKPSMVRFYLQTHHPDYQPKSSIELSGSLNVSGAPPEVVEKIKAMPSDAKKSFLENIKAMAFGDKQPNETISKKI